MGLFRLLRLWATPALLAILTILLLAYSCKIGILSLHWFKVNKDALTAINNLCTTTAVIIGGILTYYRFFRGRTFAARAELSIDVDVVEGPENSSLPLITVSVQEYRGLHILKSSTCCLRRGNKHRRTCAEF